MVARGHALGRCRLGVCARVLGFARVGVAVAQVGPDGVDDHGDERQRQRDEHLRGRAGGRAGRALRCCLPQPGERRPGGGGQAAAGEQAVEWAGRATWRLRTWTARKTCSALNPAASRNSGSRPSPAPAQPFPGVQTCDVPLHQRQAPLNADSAPHGSPGFCSGSPLLSGYAWYPPTPVGIEQLALRQDAAPAHWRGWWGGSRVDN